MNCKNCGYELDGKYCSRCGQHSKVSRIDSSSVFEDISEGIFQVNRGFFYTFSALFVRPGHAIRAFLDGKRKRHFKPVTYVITMSTLYFLLSQLLDRPTWIDDLVTGFVGAGDFTAEEASAPSLNALSWFAKNYAYVTLLLLPLFSLSSYLFFRKFKLNYLEHVVVNAYTTGHQAISYAFFAVLATIFRADDILALLPILVAIGYNFWVFNQLFSDGKWFVNLLRTLMTYLLYLVFSLIMLLAIFGIVEN